jgi:transcriptional regulator with XRE-family HTH domain
MSHSPFVDTPEPLSDRLRSARTRAGLSVRQLAALANASEATIRNYEAGESNPRPDIGARLEQALKVDLGFGGLTSNLYLSRDTGPSLTEAPLQTLLGEIADRDTAAQAENRGLREELRAARAHIADLERRLSAQNGSPAGQS